MMNCSSCVRVKSIYGLKPPIFLIGQFENYRKRGRILSISFLSVMKTSMPTL